MTPFLTTVQLSISGQVQGVGFRPFIYRLAQHFNLTGWVKNCSGEVLITAQGKTEDLLQFQKAILTQHPPLAMPEIDSVTPIKHQNLSRFIIHSSTQSEQAQRHIPADYFSCPDCLKELTDPGQRRYRYPFINCTQCGPRYTIIKDLPYDRPNTSMRDFPLCPACHQEYSNPLDRRFHAQPLACSDCGPELSLYPGAIQGNEAALKHVIKALQQGKIIAVKGIGGYHLICDATNNLAVMRLRQRKQRPDKPLAVMFDAPEKDPLSQIKHYCQLDETQSKTLLSAQRPIVLVSLKPNHLAAGINPGLNEVGAMLACSPLHYLILQDFGFPIVATSGNLCGEPVLTDNLQAIQRLEKMADLFLQHNRPILRPADDPVIRVIAHKARPFRIGRGMAPLEFKPGYKLTKPILATGGQIKNTIALGWDNRIIISPHIGDLDSKRSGEIFEQVIADLCRLYRVTPEIILCDSHPDYYSSRYAAEYARQHNIPRFTIQHHKAHAAIVAGEYPQYTAELPWLVFTWDGTGLGEDNSIWGAEGFYGQPGQWQRISSIKPFKLQGADKASREPWRSACALIWETQARQKSDRQSQDNSTIWSPELDLKVAQELAFSAWQKDLNTYPCRSMGRLFDAASAILSLGNYSSFEGQGPMLLESLISTPLQQSGIAPLSLYTEIMQKQPLIVADWADSLTLLMDQQRTIKERAALFHEMIAETLIAQAMKIRALKGNFNIGLSGGVFQNRILTEYILLRLKEQKFNAFLPQKIPYNDAGLAFGQIIEGMHYV